MKSMLIPILLNNESGRHWQTPLVFGLFALSLCITCRAEQGGAAERTIVWAESLAADAVLSRDQKLPILIFVTQQGCQFCAALRRQVLYPMIRAGELSDKAIIREVSLDTGFTLSDFNSEEIPGRQFADRYAAALTPTILFLDSTGMEIAEKKVGISNIEYYGFYLLKSLASARGQLKKKL